MFWQWPGGVPTDHLDAGDVMLVAFLTPPHLLVASGEAELRPPGLPLVDAGRQAGKQQSGGVFPNEPVHSIETVVD